MFFFTIVFIYRQAQSGIEKSLISFLCSPLKDQQTVGMYWDLSSRIRLFWICWKKYISLRNTILENLVKPEEIHVYHLIILKSWIIFTPSFSSCYHIVYGLMEFIFYGLMEFIFPWTYYCRQLQTSITQSSPYDLLFDPEYLCFSYF